MFLILITIAGYILIGGLGMALANRKSDRIKSRQRWLKYGTYLLIVTLVIESILWSFFTVTAGLILLVGYYELIQTGKNRSLIPVLLIYTLVGAGFMWFAMTIDKKFQLFLYFQVFTFDAFSQVTGQLFGRTPLVPRISPAKTVEGFIGGTLFCLLSSLVAAGWAGVGFPSSIFIGLFTAVVALSGDLLASAYKRRRGIKDYSNLLPGQGGFLDRFDSFILTGAVFALILYHMNGT